MNIEYNIEEITQSDIVEDYLFKIVVVGDCAVGKSNILSRFITNKFNKESKSTMIELSTKVFKINDKIIKWNIWDTAGQERFTSITSAYYKGAKGALIVYDITRKDTFNHIDKWIKELKMMLSWNLNIIWIGNKSDLSLLRQVSYEEAEKKAKDLNLELYETSALDSHNVDAAFKRIIIDIYENVANNKNNTMMSSFQWDEEKNLNKGNDCVC